MAHRFVSVQDFQPGKGFLPEKQKLVREKVIPYQYRILNDEVEGAEKSHALKNIETAGKVLQGKERTEDFYGMVFQDSDVAKWMEAASYALALEKDAELEEKLKRVISLFGDSQWKDGYINSYFTVKSPGRRWTNLQEAHELYCAGHLMEAACARWEATGKTDLLDIMEKNAQGIYRHFVEEDREGYPGHPEVELALLRLYEITGKEAYKTLALRFLDKRGQTPNYFQKESETRGWTLWGMKADTLLAKDYAQNSRPVWQQEDAVGHAVRAVYLYTAMAKAAALEDNPQWKESCQKLWRSIVDRRMFITGGIGSADEGEAFTVDYDLPNDINYAETCASIGLIFFAKAMLAMDRRGEYGDVMEQALYNTVLAGMSQAGTEFFYVNPLEVVPSISHEAVTKKHVDIQRPRWYACACCPPNVARLLESIGSYAYSEDEAGVYVHLFAAGKVQFQNGCVLSCETAYPHEGEITFTFASPCETTVFLRIPGWSKETKLEIKGVETEVTPLVSDGYAEITGPFAKGDTIVLTLDMTPRKMYASSRVPADSGRVAVMRGPLVYCAEGVDQQGDVLSLLADETAQPQAQPFDADLLGGVVPVTLAGWRIKPQKALYSSEKPEREACQIQLIPYYSWGNRGETQMRVWLPET